MCSICLIGICKGLVDFLFGAFIIASIYKLLCLVWGRKKRKNIK